ITGSYSVKTNSCCGNYKKEIDGLNCHQELLNYAPPNSTAATWDGQFEMMRSGKVALVQSWSELFPGLDANDSKVPGLWEPAKPLTPTALRSPADCGFNEKPNAGHQ